jgi:hypothetical protein
MLGVVPPAEIVLRIVGHRSTVLYMYVYVVSTLVLENSGNISVAY